MKYSPAPFPLQGESNTHPRNLSLVNPARILRRRLTDTERKLWHQLRGRRFEGYKFRRQYPVGNYIVDFICIESRLIIELDGGQHASTNMQDAIRDNWLKSQGYTILRLWNHEVLTNVNGVLEVIRIALFQTIHPHPNPLPGRERGKLNDYLKNPSPFQGEGWGEGEIQK